MAWTRNQKLIAARSCKAAGISEEQRKDLILRNFRHAHFNGAITSTSPALNCQDFGEFMRVVERFAGGTILHFTAGYWKASATDTLARMKHKAQAIALSLESKGRLAGNGIGLAGWISKRVTRGETDRISDLDYHALMALIVGLQAYSKQTPAVAQAV